VNPKRIVVALLLALFASGLCTWIVSRKLNAPAVSQTAPAASYAVPSRALQSGEVLNPGNTEMMSWPRSVPIAGAFSRIADVTGRAVLFPLAKGQPILDRDLAAAGSGIGLAIRIPDGMRAVALRSDEVVGVAGFLLPGSHVDVLVTYRSDRLLEPLTATVLEDAIVLATGHQVEPDPDGKTSDVTVVTLLLTPDESQRAVLASTQGAIHFVLRNGGDAGRAGQTTTLLSELAGRLLPAASPVPRSPAVQVAPPALRPYQVETVLGATGEARVVAASFPGSAISQRSPDAFDTSIPPRSTARPSSSAQPSQPQPAVIRRAPETPND
jgi:pilus assembly protein CpaB